MCEKICRDQSEPGLRNRDQSEPPTLLGPNQAAVPEEVHPVVQSHGGEVYALGARLGTSNKITGAIHQIFDIIMGI